jgi:anhydro-N-acetylmuramic acid kinase
MKYDENGKASNIGKTSEVILNQAIDNFDNISNQKKLSFDIKDFDLSFVKGLTYEDGLSTLVDFTAIIIYQSILKSINSEENKKLLIIVLWWWKKKPFINGEHKEKTTKKYLFKNS